MNNEIKVSVIVPVYNVEEYLKECLDSIVRQTLKQIEVIMVDDGSEDSSVEIAKVYEEKYENFKLICQPNGGLGKARNVGMEYATGEYIAFMDSDDYISKTAYENMYNAAKANDCDIVIGNVKRFNSKKEYASVLHTRVFKENIEATDITKTPELIYDTTAWNKLFKRSFWEANNFKFPEGILYEDIPVTVPAHFLSNCTAVLEEVIYYWRQRDGISKSITQNRTDINNFLDRLTVLKSVDKFYEENVKDEKFVYDKYFKWLDMDFILYINQLDIAGDEYREALFEKMQEYLKTVPQNVMADLKAIDRIKYYLIEQNDLDTLLKVLDFQKTQMKYLNVVEKNGKYFGEFPFENVPKEYFEMTRELELVKLRKKIEKVTWKENLLNISGYMFLSRVNLSKQEDIKIEAKLVNTSNGKTAPITIENTKRPKLTQRFGIKIVDSLKLNNRMYNYDWAGFKASVDFSNKEVKALGEGILKIVVNADINGLKKEFFLGEPVKGSKPRSKPYVFGADKFLMRYNSAYDLKICKYREYAAVTDISFNESNLCIQGWVSDETIKELMLYSWKLGIEKRISINIDNEKEVNEEVKEVYPNSKSFKIQIPLDNMKEVESIEGTDEIEDLKAWHMYYILNDEKMLLCGNIVEDEKSMAIHNDKMIKIKITSGGTIWLSYSEMASYLDDIQWQDDKLKVTVAIAQNFFENKKKPSKVRLRSQGMGLGSVRYIECVEEKIENGLNKYTFVINTLNDKNENNFVADKWINYIEYTFEDETIRHCVITNKLGKEYRKTFKTHNYIPYKTKNGYFGIHVKLKWGWLEKGPRRREAIQRYLYPVFNKLPLKKKRVMFEVLWGQKYHCNPRALYEYIDKNHKDYECIWSFNDESTPIEGSAKKVRRWTLKYYYYMATSKYFVNNVNFPDFFEKRKGMVEIQTMHGTPLKTLGLDIPNEFPTQDSLDKFLRRCGRWDHIVVQSDEVAEITKRCYAFEKDHLKVGYPRNDVLFTDNKEQIINKVKTELDIPSDKKVILYAPTWRVKDKFDLQLDLEEMKQRLGEEYVLLLRVHPLAVKGLNPAVLNDFVKDVSYYGSVEELFMITDILMTDYSSLMFDYAILNRPMIFFTYDLDAYKNNLRGFNLDFEAEAPGPILFTSDEVIDTIENIENVTIESKNKIDAFRQKFCQYEDGNASKKIFEKVFK